MPESRATVSTEHAVRCVTRLCRHWSHKFQVSVDETRGEIFFDPARCILTVIEGGLQVLIEAPDEATLDQLEPVVANHMQRMVADETLQISWQR
ncbi:DUF2218 domain-containing protein [Pseudomonas seleniipraecipitans]|uniref:DUF2218 domain-containing protein n=1 Tax=Phytopseudomonas seleniipraecipitans TaxID=640205 RepID=A0ABY5J781_9GAMM|nr:DUF2218 domain-containing protein [Pseudomonas seleniipraecipitans]UUD63812.1 DUF2218 domain-containing protein [Pseudomonas seleniipraecipitans]